MSCRHNRARGPLRAFCLVVREVIASSGHTLNHVLVHSVRFVGNFLGPVLVLGTPWFFLVTLAKAMTSLDGARGQEEAMKSEFSSPASVRPCFSQEDVALQLAMKTAGTWQGNGHLLCGKLKWSDPKSEEENTCRINTVHSLEAQTGWPAAGIWCLSSQRGVRCVRGQGAWPQGFRTPRPSRPRPSCGSIVSILTAQLQPLLLTPGDRVGVPGDGTVFRQRRLLPPCSSARLGGSKRSSGAPSPIITGPSMPCVLDPRT